VGIYCEKVHVVVYMTGISHVLYTGYIINLVHVVVYIAGTCRGLYSRYRMWFI
jgi:hypothetical protein